MKIAMIHGQNHRGSTYHIGAMLAEKLGGEVTEFFLPRDFGEFCVGCNSCFMKAKEKCPHYEKLIPINKAIKEADVIILTSPVYVYHVTGPMKSWLDHYGHQWMVHRPDERMFTKQAVCISTAAGKGTKSTNQDMADSLWWWGVGKIYKYGENIHAVSYKTISEEMMQKIDFHSVAVARYAALIQAKSSTSQAQPSENERILICGLGASVGYERVERVFNTPRLKSQIRILSFSEGVCLASILPAANQISTSSPLLPASI